MDDQLLFFAAAALTVCVAGSVDVIVSNTAAQVGVVRQAFLTYPGTVAGAAFMMTMVQTDVAPQRAALAFLAAWVATQAVSAEFYGVRRDQRLRRAALAAAFGGLGVLLASA